MANSKPKTKQNQWTSCSNNSVLWIFGVFDLVCNKHNKLSNSSKLMCYLFYKYVVKYIQKKVCARTICKKKGHIRLDTPAQPTSYQPVNKCCFMPVDSWLDESISKENCINRVLICLNVCFTCAACVDSARITKSIQFKLPHLCLVNAYVFIRNIFILF